MAALMAVGAAPAHARPFLFAGDLDDGSIYTGTLNIDAIAGYIDGADATVTGPSSFHFTFVSVQVPGYYTPTSYEVDLRNAALTEDFDFGINRISLVGFTGQVEPAFGNLYDLITNTPGPFIVLTAVPEPATWAMMLVGVGGLGAISRRRRAMRPLTVA